MNITKPQTKILIHALYEAIETMESLIDAHRIAWDQRRTGMPKKCIPKEYRKDVNNWQRQIERYKKLSTLLKTSRLKHKNEIKTNLNQSV